MNIDLNKYKDFVDEVTSDESSDAAKMINTILRLQAESGVKMSNLLTAGIGMSSEGGEFNEIIKKCIFQGKPMDEDTIYHMKRELGDVIWYWMQACIALGEDPNDIINMNVEKLQARYPGGEFNPYYSENRKEGDI